jgi:hypothetical protein
MGAGLWRSVLQYAIAAAKTSSSGEGGGRGATASPGVRETATRLGKFRRQCDPFRSGQIPKALVPYV